MHNKILSSFYVQLQSITKKFLGLPSVRDLEIEENQTKLCFV